MPVTGFILSESDRDALREMLEDWRKNRSNTNRAVSLPRPDFLTPEVYVALAPIGGIPARFSTTPGAAECNVYRVVPSGASYTLEVVGISRTIFNLSEFAIESESWIVVTRDKFGAWLVAGIASFSSEGTGTGTGGGFLTFSFDYVTNVCPTLRELPIDVGDDGLLTTTSVIATGNAHGEIEGVALRMLVIDGVSYLQAFDWTNEIWTPLVIQGSPISFQDGASVRWEIDETGHFVGGADNALDIGRPTDLRPRSIYVGTHVDSPSYTFKSGSANPIAGDIPAGRGVVWKNTSSGEVRLWVNDGGTLKSTAALT